MAAVLDARRQIWRIFLMLVWRTQGGRAPLGSSFCYDLGGGCLWFVQLGLEAGRSSAAPCKTIGGALGAVAVVPRCGF
jgi:hypothetical protein